MMQRRISTITQYWQCRVQGNGLSP